MQSPSVSRLYNPDLGSVGNTSHYYTSNTEEIAELTSKHGWDLERSKNGDTGVFSGILALTDPLTIKVEHFYTVNHYLENLNGGYDRM